MKYMIIYAFLWIVTFTAAAQTEYTDELLDVPYVPTPQRVVDRMLEIAAVTAADTLFDLGCGDGRIANTAALKYGALTVGIDIDPKRIEESKESARGLGVADRAMFIEQDLFETDIRSATVVTLYLLRSVNLALRPKLFRDLRPGTRIVSHDFSMGDWLADRRIPVDNDAVGSHRIYYWVMPANVSGEWRWIVPASPVSAFCSLTVEQEFQRASGTIIHGGTHIQVRDMNVNGPVFSFVTEETSGGMNVTRIYTGKVDGNTIRGTVELAGSGLPPSMWEAVRDPSTVVPLEDFTKIK